MSKKPKRQSSPARPGVVVLKERFEGLQAWLQGHLQRVRGIRAARDAELAAARESLSRATERLIAATDAATEQRRRIVEQEARLVAMREAAAQTEAYIGSLQLTHYAAEITRPTEARMIYRKAVASLEGGRARRYRGECAKLHERIVRAEQKIARRATAPSAQEIMYGALPPSTEE